MDDNLCIMDYNLSSSTGLVYKFGKVLTEKVNDIVKYI